MTFHVLGVRAFDANMQAVPGTMPAFWTTRATTMSVQNLIFRLAVIATFPSCPDGQAHMSRRTTTAMILDPGIEEMIVHLKGSMLRPIVCTRAL